MKKGDLISEKSLLDRGFYFKRIRGIAEEWIKDTQHLYWSRSTCTVIETFTDNDRFAIS